MDGEKDTVARVHLHPGAADGAVDEEEVDRYLGPEGDPDPAADQGGHGVVSGQGHPGGDDGEEGTEGDPPTAGDPFSVRTVP